MHSTTDLGDMDLLILACEVDLPLSNKLLECSSERRQCVHNNESTRPWFNRSQFLSVGYTAVCTGLCSSAVEVAEEHFVFLQRLLSATNHGFRDWWRLAPRSGAFNMKVTLGQGNKKKQFVVKLPRVREKGEEGSLMLSHRVQIENVTADWSVKAWMGFSYMIGRALLMYPKEVGVWEKVKRTRKQENKVKAIERLTELTTKSLLRGKRIFEVDEVDWTKEFGLLVKNGWGLKGVFEVKEESGGCDETNRCVVVHLDAVYITLFEQRKLLLVPTKHQV